MTKTNITILAENTARDPGLLAEHGLAYWIEYDGRRVLLDSGQGGVLVGNAYRLGIVLHDLDALVLSHGHYDHTGGVANALKTNRSVMVHAHRPLSPESSSAKGTVFRGRSGCPTRPSRPSETRAIVWSTSSSLPPCLKDLWRPVPVPRLTDFEDVGGPFYLDDACTRPDPLEDDQSVFFDTPQGTVVLLGCAHSGVINTLRYIRQLTGDRPLHAVFGGMHLVGASIERIDRTIDALRQMGVEQLMPAHCTGFPATVALWNAFPGQCTPCFAGARFTFDR